MSQPESNDPLSTLPELGELMAPPSVNLSPRDPDKEALAASLRSPDWIPQSIDIGKATGAPAPVHQVPMPAPAAAAVPAIDPNTPLTMQQMLSLMQHLAQNQAQPAPAPVATPAPQPFVASPFVPPPTPGPAAGSVKVPAEPLQHPVITDLLREFGITSDKVIEHTYKGHTYRLREANADLTNYVLGAASSMSLTDADYVSRTRLMTAALSVIAIDGTPVLDLFQWDSKHLRRGEVIDKAFPPVSAIVKIAPELFRFFLETLKLDVVADLAEKYDAVFGETEDEEATKTPVAMLANDTRVRFKCSAAGCGHVEDIVPEYVDEAKTSVRVRYCSRDGAPMTPIGRLKDLGNLPLA